MKHMFKLTMMMMTALLVATLSAQATLYYQGSGVGSGTDLGAVVNGTITDGNLIGTVNQMSLSGLGSELTGLSVTLNLSGGYNGDLYGYLTYNGTMVVLLNRIGVSSSNPYGNNTSGMTVTFSDASGGGDIHLQTGTLGSSYQADRRTVSPLGLPATFDASPTGSTLGAFNSVNPNGTWTLFLADVAGGGGNATLVGWGVDITAVPEPTTWALLATGTLAGGAVLVRRRAGLRKLAARINAWVDAV
jgi:hypothetical protein